MDSNKRKLLKIIEEGKVYVQATNDVIPKEGIIFSHEDDFRIVCYQNVRKRTIRIIDFPKSKILDFITLQDYDGLKIIGYDNESIPNNETILTVETGEMSEGTGEYNYRYSRYIGRLIDAYSKEK